MGLILGLVGVVAPDINKLVNLLMGLVLYITPVIYSEKIDNPMLQTIMKYNPLTYLISGIRDAILYGYINNFDIFLYISLGVFLLFLFSWRIYYIAEPKVIEKMI